MDKFTEDDRKVIEFGIQHNLGIRYKEAAQNLLDDYDTARASEARLREALKQANDALEKIHDDWAEPSASAAGGQIANICLIASLSIDTALSDSSGEWLERHDAEIVARCSQTVGGESWGLRLSAEVGGLREQNAALLSGIREMQGDHHCLGIEAACRLVGRRTDERDAALARAEKAEAERDGLAEQLHNVRDSLLAYFSGSFLDSNIFTDEYKATLAAHDALITAEARRGAALLEVYERVKNLRGCNAYDVIDSIEEMARETTDA